MRAAWGASCRRSRPGPRPGARVSLTANTVTLKGRSRSIAPALRGQRSLAANDPAARPRIRPRGSSFDPVSFTASDGCRSGLPSGRTRRSLEPLLFTASDRRRSARHRRANGAALQSCPCSPTVTTPGAIGTLPGTERGWQVRHEPAQDEGRDGAPPRWPPPAPPLWVSGAALTSAPGFVTSDTPHTARPAQAAAMASTWLTCPSSWRPASAACRPRPASRSLDPAGRHRPPRREARRPPDRRPIVADRGPGPRPG